MYRAAALRTPESVPCSPCQIVLQFASGLNDLEAFGERILVVDPDLVEARCDGGAFDRGNDRCVIADTGLFFDASGEAAADVALMDKALAHREPTLGMEMGEPRRRAGAARAAIDRPLAIEDRVPAVRALTLRCVGPHHVTDAANGGIERMNG